MSKIIKTLNIFVFIFFFFTGLQAEGKYVIKIGSNYSNFVGENAPFRPGITAGLGREWKLFKNTGVTRELLFSTKHVLLRNKSIGGYSVDDLWVRHRDIFYSAGFLELSINLNYHFILYNNLKFNMGIGPSFSLGFLNLSKTTLTSFANLSQEDRKKYKFDYLTVGATDYGFLEDNSGFCFNYNLNLNFDDFFLECIYSRSFYEINEIKSIGISRKLDTIHFLIGYRL